MSGKSSHEVDSTPELFLIKSSNSIETADQMGTTQDLTGSPASNSFEDSMDFEAFFTSVTSVTAPENSADVGIPPCSPDHCLDLARKDEKAESSMFPIPGSGKLDSPQSNHVSDDLADLEAWLLSGEVEIVSRLS